jgi:arylsulfatase A-like enzyme
VRQLRSARGSIELVLSLALVAVAGQQAVAIDLNGPWRVGLYVTRSALTFSDFCTLTVTQTGSILAATGSCHGEADPVSLQGAIDPDTGQISGSGTIGTCGAIVFSGSAAANALSFTGQFECSNFGVSGGINANRCGNGQIDPGETCDDGDRNGGCCTRGCVLLPAGTRCADDGSQCTSDQCNASGDCEHTPLSGFCNDRNSCTTGDACVNGLCTGHPLPDSSPCDDGNVCTSGDRCSGGSCVAAPVTCPACLSCSVTHGCIPMIANGCKQSPASSLILKHRTTDTVAWSWERGDATSPADLGNPTSTTDYDFCIFDGSVGPNGISPLVFGARVPTGSDWSPTGKGFRYSRPDLFPDGVRRILANAGADDRSRMTARARGPNFALPPLQALTLPLSVQLTARDDSSAQCWSARYDETRTRSGQRLTADVAVDTFIARPNILLIDLDDTRGDGIDRMPNLATLAAQGVSFSNSFAVSPLCAPSRATMLTGLSSEHHGVRTLNGALGGAPVLREQGTDRETVATWLQAAGYRTGLFGKYVNGYGYGASEQSGGPGGTYYVPPGWTRWRAMTSPEHFGGVNGFTYTVIDEHGAPTVYGDHVTDAQYSTDVLAGEVRTFIADSVGDGRPFFAVWTPYASHVETNTLLPEPAARHFGFFTDLPLWRPANWAEADVSDKPQIMQTFSVHPTLIGLTDRMRIGAYESLLAVDEQLRVIQDQLAELGIDQNTVIIVTSDNGACWGEHRLFTQSKDCLYEECLRVPMIIYDPRVSLAGAVQAAPVLNVDLAPTVAAFAGVEPPVALDGVSLAPWVTGPPPAQWRGDFLAVHWRATRDEILTYTGQVTDGDQVRLYYGDSRAQPRPSILFEFDADNSVSPGAVRVAIGADAEATFANLANAVPGQVPSTSTTTVPSLNQVNFIAGSPQSNGVFLAVERDQANMMRRNYVGADAFGVRDVANGFSYVQHETGEFELYDLNLDPAQLENKAGDPSYAATRARLADRLSELLH